MKRLLIFTLLVISLTTKAQNGGQYFENNVIQVQYLGYSNGTHVAKVCNKQNCEATIRTKADRDPAIDVVVPAESCKIVTVARPTATEVLFRAKAETSCPNFTNPDMGWLEIKFPNYILELVGNNFVRSVTTNDNNIVVKLENGILKSDFGSASYYQNVEVCDLYGRRVFLKRYLVRRHYELDLRHHMRNGYNFIKVNIESPSNQKTIVLRIIKK